MDAFLRTRLSDLVSRGGHCCLLQEHGSGDDDLRTQCRKIGESGELWGPTERRGPRPQRKWWGGCVHPQSPPRRDVLGCRGQPSFLSSQSLNSDNEVPCQGCAEQLCPPQALLEWQARLEVFSEKGSLDLQGPAELLRLS